MTYHTNRLCQRRTGDKNLTQNNFFASRIIDAYISVKICIMVNNNKKFPKNNRITSYTHKKLNATIFKSFIWTGWVMLEPFSKYLKATYYIMQNLIAKWFDDVVLCHEKSIIQSTGNWESLPFQSCNYKYTHIINSII